MARLVRCGSADRLTAPQANTFAPLCGWLAGRAERVSSQLLAAASWAGAAARTVVAIRATTGSPAARVASTVKAPAIAAAEATLVAAIVGVWRRHRRDRIVTLPGASFQLQEVHPRSCYVHGLVANFLLKVLIGLAPLELYL